MTDEEESNTSEGMHGSWVGVLWKLIDENGPVRYDDPSQPTIDAVQLREAAKHSDLIEINEALELAADHADLNTMHILRECGATDFDSALIAASTHGRYSAMCLAHEWGATSLDAAMIAAVGNHDVSLCMLKKLCLWGATNYDDAYSAAAFHHDEMSMDLLEEKAKQAGASIDIERAFQNAARNGCSRTMELLVKRGAKNFEIARVWVNSQLLRCPNDDAKSDLIDADHTLKEFIRQQKQADHHKVILEACLALHSLNLPAYVLLEILDLALKPGPLTQIRRVAIIEGVRNSIRVVRP